MLCYEGQEDSYNLQGDEKDSISTIFIKKQYLILFYHVWRRIYILTAFILILLYIYICLEKNQTNEGKERKTKMFIYLFIYLVFLKKY